MSGISTKGIRGKAMTSRTQNGQRDMLLHIDLV